MVSSYVFVSSIIIGLFSPLIFGIELKQVYETQVQKEFFASNVYLTFAHHLATRGVYNGFAKFFFDSAEEERDHGKKLIDFYNVRDRDLLLQDIIIDDTIANMIDLTEIIKKAKELEQDVYNNLIEVRQAANDIKDYPTVHFIEKQMLEEQTTALKYMNDLVQRIQRNSNNSTIVLQMMDQDLRKKQVKQT
jgi:ferritin heavy chain